MGNLKIVLHRVSRNLNRAYRTSEFFGISAIELHRCDNSKLSGGLFAAKDRVLLTGIDALPIGDNVCYFETDGAESIYDLDLTTFDTFVFGGESFDLPKNKNIKRCVIPKLGKISGLTVEAALAIVLFERQRQLFKHDPI